MTDTSLTLAEAVVDQCVAHGVQRIFGVPGGGSSLQVIEAAARRGIPFVLTRSETPAVIMAAVTGELTGRPGAALATKGPGLANGLNGLACALLDRAPMLLFTDGFDPAGLAYQSHQVLDQPAMAAPLVKGYGRLDGPAPGIETADLLDLALTHPRGPVCVEFTAARAKRPVSGHRTRTPAPASPPGPAAQEIERARELIGAARRPAIVAGLQTVRDPAHVAALRLLADALNCPVFPTYKAKGVLPDADPRVIGLYVGGAGESAELSQADLIVLFGADPVEFALQPWRYPDHKVIDASLHPYERRYMAPDASPIGPLDAIARALAAAAPAGGSAWTEPEFAAMRSALQARLAIDSGGPITAQTVVEAARRAAPAGTRLTVDAGAHMLPAMAFWQADAPNEVLISNGLATMAFALPAAIAAALHEPQRPVIAFTGDGGLAMCLGELATAVQAGCNLTVVVFNDSALSLIGVKQARSGMAPLGVGFAPADFATAARGLGALGIRCETPGDLDAALARGLAHEGPAVVDVVIDPSGYIGQVERLRG